MTMASAIVSLIIGKMSYANSIISSFAPWPVSAEAVFVL